MMLSRRWSSSRLSHWRGRVPTFGDARIQKLDRLCVYDELDVLGGTEHTTHADAPVSDDGHGFVFQLVGQTLECRENLGRGAHLFV